MATFRDWLKSVTPTVFRGPYGEALMEGSIGLTFDDLAADLRHAVRSAFIGDAPVDPDNGPAYDALGAAGHELALPRYPGESWASYHARLAGGWDSWPLAGDEVPLVTQLEAFGGFTATIIHNRDWNWDGHPENWSRFWVVITAHSWTAWQWGDGHTWGGGQTWGSTATLAEVRAIRAIVHKWKPGKWRCENIIAVLNGTTWAAEQPDGTWGNPANRSHAAVYWDG